MSSSALPETTTTNNPSSSSSSSSSSSPPPRLVLALNSGSSSLKASVLNASVLGSSHDQQHQEDARWVTCLAERLGPATTTLSSNAAAHVHVTIHRHFPTDTTSTTHDFVQANMTHEDALQYLLQVLEQEHVLQHVVAVGHRVVHGGTDFTSSVIISDDDDVLEQLDRVSHLAPLHNPHNVHGIRTTLRLLPSHIPSVAVFDTSFHATIPPVAYTYPLPIEYRAQALQIRKYGFHGTSVMYMVETVTDMLRHMPMAMPRRGKHATTNHNDTTTDIIHDNDDDDIDDDDYNMIVCHLGNGASVTAVSRHGQSQDTTMGFTPLAGIMMGTRSGSIDPSIIPFACHALHKTVDEVLMDLNQRSGLRGMMASDGSYDMRELLQRAAEAEQQQGEEGQDSSSAAAATAAAAASAAAEAKLAVDMFVYRLCQGIAEMCIALQGPLDVLIFTAGIGEHSAVIRQRTVELLQRSLMPQLQLDETRNVRHGQDSQGIVSPPGVWPLILDLATDEEMMIVKECIRLIDRKS